MRFRSFGRQIFNMYEKYPMTLNSLIGGMVYMAGEISIQINHQNNIKLYQNQSLSLKDEKVTNDTIFPKQQTAIWGDFQNIDIDWNRTMKIGMLGAIENGVFMLTWYRFLNHMFGKGISTKVVVIKCLCDQIFFATQQDFLFLALCAYQDSSKLPAAIAEVKLTFLRTWLMDCSLWPMVNFVGFAWIPYRLQPTYMAIVQFFWQVYVSSIAASSTVTSTITSTGSSSSSSILQDNDGVSSSTPTFESINHNNNSSTADNKANNHNNIHGSSGSSSSNNNNNNNNSNGTSDNTNSSNSANSSSNSSNSTGLNSITNSFHNIIENEIRSTAKEKSTTSASDTSTNESDAGKSSASSSTSAIQSSSSSSTSSSSSSSSSTSDTNLLQLFQRIDSDGSGYIDGVELTQELTRRYRRTISRVELEKIIREVDANGDGKISFDEFKRAIQSGTAKETGLWCALREDVTLMRGAQAVLKRKQQLDAKQQHHHHHHHSSSNNNSNSNKEENNNDDLATTTVTDSSAVSYDNDCTAETNDDMKDAVMSASVGFGLLATASLIRKVIFKI